MLLNSFDSEHSGLPEPPSEEDFEAYLIEVHFVHSTSTRNKTQGAIAIWTCRSGIPLAMDENLLWCPKIGCLGMFDTTFTLSEVDQARIEKLTENYRILHNEPGGVLSGDLYPEDIKRKINGFWHSEVTCPRCLSRFKRSSLATTYHFNATKDIVASTLSDIYGILYRSASIVMRNNKSDRALKQVKESLKLDTTFDRTKYEKHRKASMEQDNVVIYRKKKIHKDLNSGKMLDKVFLDFLKA